LAWMIPFCSGQNNKHKKGISVLLGLLVLVGMLFMMFGFFFSEYFDLHFAFTIIIALFIIMAFIISLIIIIIREKNSNKQSNEYQNYNSLTTNQNFEKTYKLYCSYCRSLMTSDANFCPYCGNKII